MSRASKLRKSLLSCIDDLAEHRSEYCVNAERGRNYDEYFQSSFNVQSYNKFVY